jgi:arginase
MAVIGVPLDLGADRRGVDMGPSAIRYADLSEKLGKLGHRVEDWGNIETPLFESSDVENARAKYLAQVSQVCMELATSVTKVLKSGKMPLVLGGDHSIAIGTLAGVYMEKNEESGVVWLDAHGDCNTPDTTPSGNIHGMSLALSSGEGSKWFPVPPWPRRSVDPGRVVIVGARSLDPGEKENLRRMKVKVFTMADIDRLGMKEVMAKSIEIASSGGKRKIHVSFDMDVLDPSDAPGVGTPVRGGITYREAHLAMEMVSESGAMKSLEVVEVNPILDQQNATAELAVELILSSMGKRIF